MTEVWRVTVRADDIELRGTVRSAETLAALAKAVEPLGAMVIASEVGDG